MRDPDTLPPGLLDRLIRAFLRMRGRPDRPELPPPPDLDDYVPDPSPPTDEETAQAESAAREAMRRLRESR
jgi:hypothetical protein